MGDHEASGKEMAPKSNRPSVADRSAAEPSHGVTTGVGTTLAAKVGNRGMQALARHVDNRPAYGYGNRLDAGLASAFGQRFDHDFSRVQVHTGPASAEMARAHNAAAMTHGNDIHFAAHSYQPWTSAGQRLIAHELAHVVQFGNAGGTPSEVPVLEAEAGRAAAQAMGPWTPARVTSCAAAGTGFLCEDKKKSAGVAEADENPFADWLPDAQGLLLVYGDDRLLVLPAAKAVFFASDKTQAQFEKAAPHVTNDLGTLFEVPATGASGTRIFRAGKRSALVLDAGYDPTPGQRRRVAAVYLNEVMGIAASMGITKISRIQPIHGHSDHVVGIPALATQLQVKAENVVVPQAFQNIPAVATAVRALRTTNDPGLVAKGFGAAWAPQNMPKDKGGQGGLYVGNYSVGDLNVEMLGLRSALANAPANADLASYLTKVTRRTDNAKVAILGDFRGGDLAQLQAAMEARSPGSWREYFRGVTTISGFSHHVGRMQASDTAGMMALLDATLLSQGRLRVVEQTNLGVSAQARTDTLELAARLGIEVTYTGMPAAGGPSAAGATRDGTYARGAGATVQPIIASPLTTGLERLRNLETHRITIEQWRPWLEELNGKAKVDAAVNEIKASVAQLRQPLRAATAAAVDVRVANLPAPASGPRDYSASGGAVGQAYTNALSAIPAQVPAEAMLTPKAVAELQQLRNKNINEVPLNIAVHRAVTRGEYSDKAFRHMMNQLHPMTRDELIGRKPGNRGALVPRDIAFKRVRAQFNFQSRILGNETMSIQHLGPMAQRGARGVGGILLGLELWNSVGQPLWQAHQIGKQISVTRNLAPFLRRIAFWQQMGVKTSFFGVEDYTFASPDYYRSPEDVVNKLREGDLTAVIIEKPGLDDADVLRLGAWLTAHIRNYDEYASLFEDSFQDAVGFINPSPWEKATWRVRVGRYETSGENRVVEEWHEHPKLTELMRHFIPWLIANTRSVLEQAGKGGAVAEGFDEMLGTMAGAPTGGAALPRVRLKRPDQAPIVDVDWTGNGNDSWNRQPNRQLERATFTTPPVFHVLGERGAGVDKELKVSGADFNTYVVLRNLRTTHIEFGTYGRELNHAFMTADRNQWGAVWIDAVLTEPVTEAAPAPTPGNTAPAPGGTAAPPANAAPNPSAPVLPGPFAPLRDMPGSKPNLPLGLGPRVFDPIPGPGVSDEGKPTILPGLGGNF